MYVINLVLSEEDVLQMGSELLNALATLDTSSVMRQIKIYIANESANPEVVKMVKCAYSSNLLVFYTNMDPDLSEAIRVTGRIKFNTISYNMTSDELSSIKSSINKIHEYDDVIKPYRSPVNVRVFNDVFLLFKESGFETFAFRLKKYKAIFTDRVNSRSVGTDFKRVSFNMPTVDIVEYGINFLAEMKEKDIRPQAWRHL